MINFLTVYLSLVISVHKKSKVDADNVGEHDTFVKLKKIEKLANPPKSHSLSHCTYNSNPTILLPPTFDSLLVITYLAMHFQVVC